MSKQAPKDVLNRRGFLGAAGLLAAGAALPIGQAKAEAAAQPDPAITEVHDFNKLLGDGVDRRPYGMP